MELQTTLSLNPKFSERIKFSVLQSWLLLLISIGKKARLETSDSSTIKPNAIMWFRQDFRIHDNTALTEAAKYAARHGGCVTFVYIHSPTEDGDSVGSEGGRYALGTVACILKHVSDVQHNEIVRPIVSRAICKCCIFILSSLCLYSGKIKSLVGLAVA